jgi:ergothioneine biosynthesis protein EgtB
VTHVIQTPHHLHYGAQSLETLSAWLEESCAQTLNNVDSLGISDWDIPDLEIVNPPAWEFGHLIWFHEFWVQRLGHIHQPSYFANADAMFNSSVIAHSARWQAQLPSVLQLKEYFQHVMGASRKLLQKGNVSPEQAYFLELAIYHQDMHNEAFAYMCQTLEYDYSPPSSKENAENSKPWISTPWLTFPNQTLLAGSTQQSGLIFDNEKWQEEIHLPAFTIATQAVTNGQYLAYLQANQGTVKPPVYWECQNQQWYQRRFKERQILPLDEPVRHLSWMEAMAYCEWQRVRLPTEFEMIALLQSSPQTWQPSNLWEWTSSVFTPFAGFAPDPYVDYSQPWFDGSYRVLKGFSSLTPKRLRRPQFRNFYQTTRNNHFCGFRTCVIDF